MIHHARAPHARTVATVRLLQSLGQHTRRRGGRLPRQLQPDAIRNSYFAAIRPVCDLAHRHFSAVAPGIIHLLAGLRLEQGRTDAPGDRGGPTGGSWVRPTRARDVPSGGPTGHSWQARQAIELIDVAQEKMVKAIRPADLHAVARQFGKATSEFQRAQLDIQVRAAIGVPLGAVEKPVRDKLEGFAAVNVDLIVTVPDRYFDRLRLDVQDAFASGQNTDSLTEQFADRYDISVNDARRIAVDQIGKLNGELNQARQEAMGVTGAVWRGMKDNRERDSHRDLEGVAFEWDDPPLDEDGVPITPGSPIRCRCYAEPNFGPLLDAME